jgi:ABC-2 type transport system ATP-binding protein
MLDLANVSKRYGAITAVKHLTLSIKPGDILGYLGPNGSGKSTTVKMIVGLMPPTHGHIRYQGVDIQDQLVAYKAQIGYVPEEAQVYTYLTGAEYLRLCGRLRGLDGPDLERRIERFLKIFGLETSYHTTLSDYSKGMRQKVLLSASLLHRPKILVLDEPASGLDVSTALVIREVVRALAADGCLVFYSSHELDTVERICNRVVILHDGAIVADDSAARLRELTRLPTLEDVFSRLAVRENLATVADAVLDVIRH